MNQPTPINPTGYPINGFPLLVQQAILEIMKNIQSPVPLIGTSMLSAMAFAVQHLVRVSRMPGLESPVSMSTMVIADSGERKSVTDGLTTKGIRQLEAELLHRHTECKSKASVAKRAHDIRTSILVEKLRKAINRGTPTAVIEEALAQHESEKPTGAGPRKLIYADVTAEALLHGLNSEWRSAAIFSAEGSVFMNGHAMRRLGVFNMLASGEAIAVDRKTGPSFVLKDAVVTTSVLIQGHVFDEIERKKGGMMRGSGGWTRYLLTSPLSTQGSRLLITPDMCWQHVDALARQVRALLEDPKRPGELFQPKVRTLTLSPAAFDVWRDFYNQLEVESGPYGQLSDVRDYCSRLPETVARIAAIFHEFCGMQGPISVDHVLGAILLGRWYLAEFIAIMGAGGATSIPVADAHKLHRYMNLHAQRSGYTFITKNALRQKGPIRDIRRMQDALDFMISRNMARIDRHGSTAVVEFNPAYLGNQYQMGSGQMLLSPPSPYGLISPVR